MNEAARARREIFCNVSSPAASMHAYKHTNSPEQFISISMGTAIR